MPQTANLTDEALAVLAAEFPRVPVRFRNAVLRAYLHRGLPPVNALQEARSRIIDACTV